MKHFAKLILISLLAVFSLVSCLEGSDSDLSNEKVTDPNLLSPHIEITKTIENGSFYDFDVEENIELMLYDKDKKRVTLDEGSVYVNSSEMRTDFGFMRGNIYVPDSYSSISFGENSSFDFEIELEDGRSYLAFVRAPKLFPNLYVLDEYSSDDQIEIEWVRPEGVREIKLNIEYLYTRDGEDVGYGGVEEEIDIKSDNFHIVPEFRKELGDGSKLRKIIVSLAFINRGIVDSSFAGGDITVKYERVQEIDVDWSH